MTSSPSASKLRWQGFWAVLPLLLTSAPALAQEGDVKALAESLFQQGRTLMNAEQYAEACPKLAESQRLDPAGGTIVALGMCYEKQGKTASAWAAFKEGLSAARKSNNSARMQFCEAEIAKLEAILSTLNVIVPPEARVPGLRVERDGVQLAEAAWGFPVAVDPGPHTLVASAPGYQRVQLTVEVGASRASETISVPILPRDPQVQAAPFAGPGPGTSVSSREPGSLSGQTKVGLVVGGVGVAASVAGLVVGGLALGKRSESDDKCGGDLAVCPAGSAGEEAVSLNDDAQSLATVSDILVFAGLGLAAVGAITVVLAPASDGSTETSARLTLAPGRAQLGLSF